MTWTTDVVPAGERHDGLVHGRERVGREQEQRERADAQAETTAATSTATAA